MNHHSKQVKDVEVSRSLRESGNQKFAEKEYVLCIELYTKSILSCPEDCKEEWSLAFANRSASLFQLGLYQECISDINAALGRNYPGHLLPKVLVRKGRCLKKLLQSEIYQDEMDSLQEAMKNLQVSDQSITQDSCLLKLNKSLKDFL